MVSGTCRAYKDEYDFNPKENKKLKGTWLKYWEFSETPQKLTAHLLSPAVQHLKKKKKKNAKAVHFWQRKYFLQQCEVRLEFNTAGGSCKTATDGFYKRIVHELFVS